MNSFLLRFRLLSLFQICCTLLNPKMQRVPASFVEAETLVHKKQDDV
jgi:hypothetical protein